MKSVMEASIYLIVMTFICLLSIDYITINKSLSKANETQQYIKNTVELYGKSTSAHNISKEALERAKDIASEKNAECDFEYFDSTDSYDYYKMSMVFPVKSGFFKIDGKHTYKGLVKVEREGV